MATSNTKRANGRPKAKQKQRSRLRVLVASSSPATAAALERTLRADPESEVIAASATAEHLESVVRGTDPDVLVLDADEYETANSHDVLSRLAGLVPVAAVTADPSASWIVRALQIGIRSVLPHGVSEDELQAAVRAVASGLVVLSSEFRDMILPRAAHADADEFEFPVETLTPREEEVLAMLAEGLLNKEIAERLQISAHTVKFHISSIMGKLGASSRTEAVTRGVRRGLVFL
jgi:DNA-binding NarL/FixJ family response regulator